MASGEKLVESLKALWNDCRPNQALDHRDDNIIAWFVAPPTGARECPLYIHVRHWNVGVSLQRVDEILCLILTETVAIQLTNAYPDQNYFSPKVKWDSTLRDKHSGSTSEGSIHTPQHDMSDVLLPPVDFKGDGRAHGHNINFVQIWNPGNQLGYGWRCSCERGMLCHAAIRHAHMKPYRDIHLVSSKDNAHFSIAIPLYGKLLHRVEVTYLVTQDWEGKDVQEFSFSIPTGLGEQSRFYTADDWNKGLVDPVADIARLLTVDMLGNTAEGMAHVNLSESYANGRFRSFICSYKEHNIGTNMALQTRLKNESPKVQTVLANAFTLMHYNMCLVCATNRELALMVPSQV